MLDELEDKLTKDTEEKFTTMVEKFSAIDGVAKENEEKFSNIDKMIEEKMKELDEKI